MEKQNLVINGTSVLLVKEWIKTLLCAVNDDIENIQSIEKKKTVSKLFSVRDGAESKMSLIQWTRLVKLNEIVPRTSLMNRHISTGSLSTAWLPSLKDFKEYLQNLDELITIPEKS